jgi:hypothetical protein
MYKALFTFWVLGVVIIGGISYASFERPQSLVLEQVVSNDLLKALCITDSGDAETFWIRRPSFEGFSASDVADMEEAYVASFCQAQGY